MSADILKCAKLNHFKNDFFLGNMPPNPLAMYALMYGLDIICRQSNYHYCFADKVIICTLLMCYY